MNIILNGREKEAPTLIVDIVSDLICPWCFIDVDGGKVTSA
jgi:hypothetical protein